MTRKTAIFKLFAIQFTCILFGTVGFVTVALIEFVSGMLFLILTITSLSGFLVTLVILVRNFIGRSGRAKILAITLLVVVFNGYVGLSAVVIAFQGRITQDMSPFFQPQRLSAQAAQALLSPSVEPLELQAPDGVWLRGWLVHNDISERSPLIIYFDGSGDEVSHMIPYMMRLKGWSVALVNYRGFGLSEGVPNEERAYTDAVFLYDTLSQRAGIDPSRIVAMGYSLGTGIAVYLSGQRRVVGTILTAPYDYVTLVGFKWSFIYSPLSGILRRYFNSIERAPYIHSPLLCLVGMLDLAVPPLRSYRLVQAWGGEAVTKTYPGEGHGLLMNNNHAWDDIVDFLRGFE